MSSEWKCCPVVKLHFGDLTTEHQNTNEMSFSSCQIVHNAAVLCCLRQIFPLKSTRVASSLSTTYERVKVINPTYLKKKKKRNSNSHAENQSLKHKLSAGRDKKRDPPEEARWRDRLLRGFPWSCLSPGRASLCSGAAWVSPLSLSLMGATMGQGDEITLWAAEQQVRGSTGHD